MPNINLTDRDCAIIEAALSLMYSNLGEVNELFEADFTEKEVDSLQNCVALAQKKAEETKENGDT